MVGIVAIAPRLHRLTPSGRGPKTPHPQQGFGPTALLAVAVAGLVLLALLALLALRLASGLQQGPLPSMPNSWEDPAYDDAALRQANRSDQLLQLGRCTSYKAAAATVTDAWCEANCKAGHCPADLCARQQRTAGCNDAASPLMGNTSLELLDILIDSFAERGVLVLLDLHCLAPAAEVSPWHRLLLTTDHLPRTTYSPPPTM